MKVLLIEDSPGDALMIQRVLESMPPIESTTWRHSVPESSSELDVDLVILDLGLPCFIGAEALVELRKLSPTVPVIVCTAAKSPAILTEVLELGSVVVGKGELMRKLGSAIERAVSSTPSPDESPKQRRARIGELVQRGMRSIDSGTWRALCQEQADRLAGHTSKHPRRAV